MRSLLPLVLSYGRSAPLVAPSGAPTRAWLASPPPAAARGRKGAAAATGPAVGSPVGYPRDAVEACLARLRAANVHAVAAALLRAEPFASARRVGGAVRGGVLYTSPIDPWERMWPPGHLDGRDDERGRAAVEVARYYAAAVADPGARPRNVAPGFFDLAVEPVPTHDRTPAWEAAWARWALDAARVALDTPSYAAVAPALVAACGSLGTTTVLP